MATTTHLHDFAHAIVCFARINFAEVGALSLAGVCRSVVITIEVLVQLLTGPNQQQPLRYQVHVRAVQNRAGRSLVDDLPHLCAIISVIAHHDLGDGIQGRTNSHQTPHSFGEVVRLVRAACCACIYIKVIYPPRSEYDVSIMRRRPSTTYPQVRCPCQQSPVGSHRFVPAAETGTSSAAAVRSARDAIMMAWLACSKRAGAVDGQHHNREQKLRVLSQHQCLLLHHRRPAGFVE